MGTVYLIPSLLHEEGVNSIPFYITNAIKECDVFFVENERTARRYFKQLWKTLLPEEQIIIDNYEWHIIADNSAAVFSQKLKEGKNIGIVSEAGCPAVADPGQQLVDIAQQMNADVKPLVGPSSVLLALMASGLNGQRFQFSGYLPVKEPDRTKAIKELEAESARKHCTQIFIETPYRNNQLVDAILKICNPTTKLCIAVDITGSNEWIKTKTITDWKKHKPDIHKRPAIYLLYAG
ncbi:MAG: SAM-dependent methyltransferase [Sphingobacteriales bacterium]|nr:SAM-dependent methyltransferase [Sphingobacteriales bacterium]